MFQGTKSHVYTWRMGSIASVLQWHCSECSLINPTETLQCARCGLSRVKSDERAASTYLLLRDSLTQCPNNPRIENRSYSSSGSSSPPTPPPRHRITADTSRPTVGASASLEPKEPIKLPPVPPLQQNHNETFLVLRYDQFFSGKMHSAIHISMILNSCLTFIVIAETIQNLAALGKNVEALGQGQSKTCPPL